MSSDQPVRPGEVGTTNNHGGAVKILSEQSNSDFANINNRSQITADSAAMAASLAIPPLQISGLDSVSTGGTSAPQGSPFDAFLHGISTVASDLGTGMVNEIKENPGDVGKVALAGLGIGVALTAAAFFLPEVAFVGTLAGGAYLLSQMVAKTPAFVHDSVVVSHPERFSASDVAQSHSDLQNDGKGITLTVAAAAGGLAVALPAATIVPLF